MSDSNTLFNHTYYYWLKFNKNYKIQKETPNIADIHGSFP